MISFKKSYAEQLFQLALALSLLRVDPDSYLGYGWESQLASLHDGGDGWQLELRAAPLTDYPYANRKALMPIIEDLARFRETFNPHDVTAYLLNVQNGGLQNHTANEPPPPTTVSSPPSPQPPSQQDEQRNATTDALSEPLDIYSDLHDAASIFDQNLADLSDYGDLPFSSFSIINYPLKDEPPELPLSLYEERRQRERASTSFSSEFESIGSPESNFNSTAVIDWQDYFNVTKTEDEEEEIEEEECTVDLNNNSTATVDIKEETASELDVKEEIEIAEEELSIENSDLIEVLYKQDVDLGFSLPQPESKKEPPPKQVEDDEDEIEKLKALLEVKQDEESKIEDEWAGFNVTIDQETGEYIQLPPIHIDDALLDEVLQLPEFDLVTDEDEETLVDAKSISSDSGCNNNSSDTSSVSESEPLKSESATAVASATKKDAVKKSATGEDGADCESSSTDSDKLDDTEEGEGDLVDLLTDMMIQSASAPFQHPRPAPNYSHGMNSFRQSSYHHQSRVPFNRTVSMEQRWQDLANLLSLQPGMGVGDMAPPHPHYPSHYPHHYQAATPISQHGPQFPHHHPHHGMLHHNATLAEMGPTQPHYGPNLGSAVSTSMHLTNSSSETDAGATGYKHEHDMMYYSNTSSELNHTNDGFLNSFLNDEDLQLMDMGVNDPGMYTMRLLEHNSTSNNSSVLGNATALGGLGGGGIGSGGLLSTPMQTSLGQIGSIGGSGDRLDASSDSAVSSMGSERVPSLSDGEWGDGGSDSAQEYHQSKYGPFDYSYSSRPGEGAARQPPVAQKKHHMFGKRYFQEQSSLAPNASNTAEQQVPSSIKYEYEPYGIQQPPIVPHSLDATIVSSGAPGPLSSKQLNETEMKYSCSVDFSRQSRQMQDLVSHNHSYTLPQISVGGGGGATPRIHTREKKLRKPEDEHLTRDEKKAREHKIPMTVQEIINLPMDEFNERLSKYDLTEVQLSLIRDIRRRGKNKVAAQNCRKRKLDQISTLADEVRDVRRRKERLLSDRESALSEQKHIMEKFSALYRHVFQYLRDPDGNPYSPTHFRLQLSTDGNVFVLPRDAKENSSSSGGGGSSSNGGAGSSSHHHHNHHHHHQHPHHKE